MANWNSLRPLKVHLRIISVIALILIGVLILSHRHAFKTYNAELNIGKTSTVKAKGGLSIRETPSLEGIVLITAPNKANVEILDNNAAADNIGGKQGTWYKIKYNDVTGYAWGNNIEQ